MKVEVDRGTRAISQAEECIEGRDGVSVQAGGVDPADDGRPGVDRGRHQLGRAWADEHALLRERHQLDIDDTSESRGRLQGALDVTEAYLRVNVDVGAYVGRTVIAVCGQQPRGALGHGGQTATAFTLMGEEAGQPGLGPVWAPRLAPQGGGDVGVTIDESG